MSEGRDSFAVLVQISYPMFNKAIIMVTFTA